MAVRFAPRRSRVCMPLSVVAALLLCVVTVAATSKKPPAHPININSAQLQQVPGIGPATADKILQMRKSYGAFKSVDDLLAIRGLVPKRLEKMHKYLVAGKSPGTIPKASAAGNSAVPTKCSGCQLTSPETKAASAAPRAQVTMEKEVTEPAKTTTPASPPPKPRTKSRSEPAGGSSCGCRATHPLQSAQRMGHPG